MKTLVARISALCLLVFLVFTTACKKEDNTLQQTSEQKPTTDPPGSKPEVLNYPVPATSLQHKLALNGTSVKIDIDANSSLSRACRDNLGAANFVLTWTNDSKSFYDMAGKNYIFNASAEANLKNLDLPLSRIYYTYYEAGGLHNGLDMLASVCNRNNIPQEKMIVCIEHHKATSILPADAYKDAITYVKAKGYKFKYWEISNEPQYAWGSGLDDPLVYAKHVAEIYDVIKSIDSTMIVGSEICRKSYYSDQVLSNIKGKSDFIAAHWYGITNTDKYSTTDVILTENYKNLDFIAYENQNIKNRTGKVIPQIDTEWRLLADGTVNGQFNSGEYNDKCGNIVGTLFQAVRMIYAIRDNYTQGACCWHAMGAQPGVLVPSGYYTNGQELSGKTSYLYWLYYHFLRNTGEVVVGFTGSAPSYTGTAIENVDAGGTPISNTGPLTPLMVTKNSTGDKLYITVVNASDSQTVPFSATLKNFNPKQQSAICISDTDINQSFYQTDNSRFLKTMTVNVNAGEVTCSLPPLSCTFIVLSK